MTACAPENTLSAFREAVKMGSDGVELDVQRTKDNVLVVCHDQIIDRITNGTGHIYELTWNELHRFCMRDRNGEIVTGEGIPTLREVCAILPDHYFLNIELKTAPYSYPGIERQIHQELEQYGRRLDVIISSFRHQSLLEVQKADRTYKTGLLYEGGFLKIWDYVQGIGLAAYSLHPYLDHVDHKFVVAAHRHGFAVYVYLANTKADIIRMLDAEVDGIITDEVALAMNVRDGFVKRK
jgi:glycerophosphoryl diester phosphodiesterase